MEWWEVLTALGILFFILEIFVPSFIFLPMGAGLLVSAAMSALWVKDTTDVLWVSAITMGIVFVTLRKMYRLFNPERSINTASDRYVGERVEVVTKVDSQHKGEVKLYGELWNALALRDGDEFAKDEMAIVAKIDGNKLLLVKMSDLD